MGFDAPGANVREPVESIGRSLEAVGYAKAACSASAQEVEAVFCSVEQALAFVVSHWMAHLC